MGGQVDAGRAGNAESLVDFEVLVHVQLHYGLGFETSCEFLQLLAPIVIDADLDDDLLFVFLGELEHEGEGLGEFARELNEG